MTAKALTNATHSQEEPGYWTLISASRMPNP